jgi:hypothetical protein
MLARSTSPARLFATVLLLCLGSSLVAPLARAQSLADLARQEEERRKAAPAPSKVYTNKDLNAAPAGSPPPAAPAAKPPDAAAKPADGDAKPDAGKAADGSEKGPVKDQAYWAGRLKTLQDALLRDENYADAMQTRINALTTDFVNRDDPAQRAVIETNRQKAVAELARLTKSVQADKKGISDLMEEARRAGVPPGWLR